jgi:hypothetical protein
MWWRREYGGDEEHDSTFFMNRDIIPVQLKYINGKISVIKYIKEGKYQTLFLGHYLLGTI